MLTELNQQLNHFKAVAPHRPHQRDKRVHVLLVHVDAVVLDVRLRREEEKRGGGLSCAHSPFSAEVYPHACVDTP